MNFAVDPYDLQTCFASTKVSEEVDTFLTSYVGLDDCFPAHDPSTESSRVESPISPAQNHYPVFYVEDTDMPIPEFELDWILNLDTTLIPGSSSSEVARDLSSTYFSNEQAKNNDSLDVPTFVHDSPEGLLPSAIESIWSWPSLEGHGFSEGVPIPSASTPECPTPRSCHLEAVHADLFEGEVEELPAPRTQKARYAPYSRPHSTSSRGHPRDLPNVFSPTTSTTASNTSSSRTASPSISRTRRRNAQAELLPAELEDALQSPSRTCPVCGFVPATRRALDLDRHMQTHLGESSKDMWVCCGVPVADAWRYGIDDTSDVNNWKGMDLVGGCRKSFSRRDALVRHLKNVRLKCCGDMDLADRLAQE